MNSKRDQGTSPNQLSVGVAGFNHVGGTPTVEPELNLPHEQTGVPPVPVLLELEAAFGKVPEIPDAVDGAR